MREAVQHDLSKLKYMIIGHGRHGKDTVAALLADKLGLSFASSSLACAEMIFSQLKDKYGYTDAFECFLDRHNHRAEWFDLISMYNSLDKSAMAKLVYQTNDIYVGMRDWRELVACRNKRVYDVCIWVDRRQHEPAEAASSMTILPWMADYVLDNNGTLDDLERNLNDLLPTIFCEARR